MCYSEKQSKQTFIINLITCFILYSSSVIENKILALFFGFVGFMQLFDLIFWRNQNIKENYQSKINYNTTKIAMVFNHLQPIILALLIYIFKGSLGEFSKNIIILYTLFAIFYTFNSYHKIKYTLVNNINVTNDSSLKPSLKWDWNLQEYGNEFYTLFIFCLFVLFYENFSFPLNIILSFINFFTYLFSFYYFKMYFAGRFWCKLISWIPLIILIINF